jgi:type I restriction enzyme S subunit
MIRTSNVRHGRIDLDEIKYVTKDTYKRWTRRLIPQCGDVLLTRDAPVGEVGYIEGDELLFLGQRLFHYRANEDHLHKRFLLYSLLSPESQKFLRKISFGAAVEHIKVEDALDIPIPLPPLPEQEAIAGVLECWDKGIRTLEKKIDKKRLIKKGLMQKLLSGKVRLPGFSNDWKTVKLGDECELITKGTTPTSIGRSFQDEGINFIKIETLTTDGKIIENKVAFIDEKTHAALRRSQLMADDLLISIAGALGRIAIVKKGILPANTNQALAIVRLKKDSRLDLSFLRWFLRGRAIEDHITAINVQAAQANISLKDIGNFKIALLCTEEQQAIAKVLSAADGEIEALEKKLALRKDQKKYLLNNLVTGTLRLPEFT